MNNEKNLHSLFTLGRTVATPGALDLIEQTGTDVLTLLRHHVSGDWGALDEQDRQENDRAARKGSRILSAYELGPDKTRIWIITEWDRSATTLLLPGEY
ncbi:hypothetical protein [Paraburkholderia lycopersici]|uniref:Plasmid related protein n=1 Tax=Paraburkholderia lycopersici TaxID=416944 RepID=A0A1G7DJR6_9BURK|nr:hypothetical protein [Paraburkholderia lycopersici]SDE51005.1 hypothetical protein SAMN05421548_1621 [Paraburkholderia lycopersici]